MTFIGRLWKTNSLERGLCRGVRAVTLAGAVWCSAHLLCAAPALAQSSSPNPEAGKQIFTRGESPSHADMEAVLGDTAVPANLMICANCHGADGKGRPEGGVTPSEITWDALTRARVSDERMARNRPAYTVESLRNVIRHGVDPAGNELGITMPRYRISNEDLDDLIAYLKQLGVKNDPGVTATSIRVGTVIPARGPLASTGASIAALLGSYFRELNQQGGMYGRMVELEVIEARETPAETAAALEEAVRSRGIFAIVGILAPGAENRIAESLQKAAIPAVDTFGAEMESGFSEKPTTFHVLSGLAPQARVLLKFAQERLAERPQSLAVVCPRDRQQLAESVMEECRKRSCRLAAPLIVYSSMEAEKIAAALAGHKPDAVIFLGPGSELETLLDAAKRRNFFPIVLQPGPLAGGDVFNVPAEFSDRVFLSLPTLPSDMVPQALEEYAYLVRKYKLVPAQAARSLAALASAKVFVEGLRQTGRQLSREAFINTLAGLYNFNTGLTPPVTYGTTRRIGALGAYVVKLDLKKKSFTPVDSWMEQ